MRKGFPGAQLGVQSWPSLLHKHEQAARTAVLWEPSEALPDVDVDDVEEVCNALCDEHTDEGCLREQRATMCRLTVAKLHQSVKEGDHHRVELASSWLAYFSECSAVWCSGVVAAGAPHALVKVLQLGLESAQISAAALSRIAKHEHVGAVVAAGGAAACVGVLRSGPEDTKQGAALILVRIAAHEQHVSALVAAGAVGACVGVLQTGLDCCNIRTGVTAVLSYISQQQQHEEALVSAGVIETILGTWQEFNADAKFNAAVTLAYISGRLDVSDVSAVVAPLIRELQSASEEPDQFEVIGALSRILRHKQHVAAVVAGGILAELTHIYMQQNGTQRVKLQAAAALKLIEIWVISNKGAR